MFKQALVPINVEGLYPVRINDALYKKLPFKARVADQRLRGLNTFLARGMGPLVSIFNELCNIESAAKSATNKSVVKLDEDGKLILDSVTIDFVDMKSFLGKSLRLLSAAHSNLLLKFFTIDTEKFCISLTDSKITGIQKAIKEILAKKGHTTIHKLSKIIGKIVATFPCSDEAKLHYRVMDRFKVKMLIQHKYKWSAKICLTKPCLQELMWWKINGTKPTLTKYLHAVEITQHVYTDSSGGAFGGCWNEHTIQSKFNELQAGLSINTKELLAIFYTLSSFGTYLQGEHVLVHCDNTVSVSCIKK